MSPVSHTTARRCILAVPGSSEKMITKARSLEVDEIFLDLEDSVALESKAIARDLVAKELNQGSFAAPSVSVRVNETTTEIGRADLRKLVPSIGRRVSTFIIPKVESAAQVRSLHRALSWLEVKARMKIGTIRLQIQIESALGLSNVDSIAKASNRIESLTFGPGDFAASVGMSVLHLGENPVGYPGEDAYHYVLSRILIAARANNLQAIDGPYSDISNLVGLSNRSKISASLGFDGKWAIHPSQIETINQAFTPSLEAFKEAEELLVEYAAATAGENARGAVMFKGKMIDEASRKMALHIVAKGRAARLDRSSDGNS